QLMASYGEIAAVMSPPLDRGGVASRAVIDRATVHVHDIIAVEAEFPWSAETARLRGARTYLATPLLREGVPIGVIGIRRLEVRPFSDSQIALLKTFADQAVIAIENVRLFNELQTSNRELTTALDKQTATSDILRVISRSQTDVQPVFDSIIASAVRLLRAYQGALTRVVGDHTELAAFTGTAGAGDSALRAAFPWSLQAEGAHTKAVRDRASVNIADAQTDPGVSDTRRAVARAVGYRSLAAVPLLRHDEALGAIAVTRREPGGFSDDDIALLKTFADQAVIAIENARLFTELQEKNRALTQAHGQVTEALEQQTATAEILRVMSSSPTDVQPVFEAIAQSAMRLCDGTMSVVSRYDGELIHLGAYTHVSAEGVELIHRRFPMQPMRDTISGRVVLE
ncbi:MAG TPA: GAF domain-containing protein, partial [Vicinamibacterales bacterium]|nr:GAF domain-containing protein [Vicinamibacterales bacterium]